MLRTRTTGLAVTLGTAIALLAGSAVAAPVVTITSPSEGATIPSSEGEVELSGTVSFDTPAASSKRFYLRRSACGGSGAQGMRLSVIPGTDAGSGCGYDGGWNLVGTVDEQGRAMTFPALDGVPYTLDISRSLTAQIVLESYRGGVNNNPAAVAAGLANLKLTVDAASPAGPLTLGTQTINRQILPTTGRQTYDFSIPLPAAAHRRDFSGLTLTLSMTGPGVGHGYLLLSGASYLDLPVFSASFDRRVEIGLNGGPFSASGVTLSEDLTTWSARIPTPSVGNHIIRARVIQGYVTPPPIQRTIRVAG